MENSSLYTPASTQYRNVTSVEIAKDVFIILGDSFPQEEKGNNASPVIHSHVMSTTKRLCSKKI